jgi:hypothetical protein
VAFLTFPVNAYFLTFNTFNVQVALGILAAAASARVAWSWAHEGRGPAFAALSSLLAVVAVGTYQALGVVLAGGLLIAELTRRLTAQDAPGTSSRVQSFVATIRLFAPAVVAVAVSAVVTAVVVRGDAYLAHYWNWDTATPVEVLQRFARHALRYAFGAGFTGGWVLLPTSLAAMVVAAALVLRGIKSRTATPLAFFLLLIILPFLMDLVAGTVLPNRAMLGIPIVVGGIWWILGLLLPPDRRSAAILLSVTVLAGLWNAQITTEKFLHERLAFDRDREMAASIVDRLVLEGWDGRVIPIAVLGTEDPWSLQKADETFGASFFDWDFGSRAAPFMSALGHPVRSPDPGELATAVLIARSIPRWPALGSVVLRDGIGVVNLGSP